MASTRTKKSATVTKKPSGSAGPRKAPTTREAADLFSVELTPALKPEQTARLRKPLPGYVGILDDVAALLEEDAALLNLPDVTPEALLQAQEQQKYLGARAAVAQSLYRNIFEQRLQVDDRAMKMLEKIARRVDALKEDDRDLVGRWKVLLDFLGTFRQGGAKKSSPAEAAPVA